MSSKPNPYGNLTSAEDVLLEYTDIGSPEPVPATTTPGAGNALWMYQHEGLINGIPVERASAGLSIESDEMLYTAFVLDRKPCSVVIELKPKDKEGQAEYDAILDRAYKGEIILVDEIKQFDAANSCFLVFVRYDEVMYKLHPRFNYLRGE